MVSVAKVDEAEVDWGTVGVMTEDNKAMAVYEKLSVAGWADEKVV